MKLRTLNILIGVGVAATAISSAACTAIAMKKLDPNMTTAEKAKVIIPCTIAPLACATLTIIGIRTNYINSSAMINFATDSATAAINTLSNYRAPVREKLGEKKEREMFEETQVKSRAANVNGLEPPNGNYICGIINPDYPDDPGLCFISNPVRIKEGLLDLNTAFTKRVHGSDLNDARISLEEFYFHQGVNCDNKVLRSYGWTYQHDGPVEIHYAFDQTSDGQPFCGIIFSVDPHPIY